MPGVPSFSEASSALGPTPVTQSFYGDKNSGCVDSTAVVQSGANAGEIFEDTTVATAILDRLLHHATVITIAGDSYRMRSHRDALQTARAALSGG